MLKLYNTLTKKKEIFKPLKDKKVLMYTCGPTVYDYDHLGHAWNYTQADILRRVLEYNGYKVKQVMNITDVGHLTSDADTGEDKMEKSAREKKKNVWEIADFFTKIYFENRKKLNLFQPHIICKATNHIKEMIELIEKLFKKGYAYKIDDGIYFDVQKFPKYGRLSGNTLNKLKAGARIEVNPQKKHPADFALWKFTPKGTKRQMEWGSPWAPPGVRGKVKGFPGWHIECSAMSMKYLGKTFDIHSGGEDNIFPHHESEIAQAEASTGKKFVNFWFHPRFLKIEGQKMSKSLKNFFTLTDVEKKGFSPLALRYLFLTGHYHSSFNFTWRGLESAQTALNRLRNTFSSLNNKTGKIDKKYKQEFLTALNNNLDTSAALAITWNLLKNKKIKEANKKKTLLDFDKVLGLNLNKSHYILKTETGHFKVFFPAVKMNIQEIPENIKNLLKKRQIARKQKNWKKADEIRKEIEKLGYRIEDTKKGPVIKK